MDNLALIESFGDFKDEKGISKIDLMAIIEDSLKTLLRKRYDSDDHFIACINYAMDHEYIGVKPEYVKGAGNNGNNKYTRNGSKTNIKPDYGSGFDEFN